MTPQQMEEKARALFMKNYHWSQAVLAVGQEKLGIADSNLLKAMDIFGGGLGAHGEVCGACVGGLTALSLRYGRVDGEGQASMKMWSCAFHFIKRFREEAGGGNILCRDIVNVNWMDPKQAKAYHEGEKFLKCAGLTGKAARIMGEVLDFAETKK